MFVRALRIDVDFIVGNMAVAIEAKARVGFRARTGCADGEA